MFLGCTVLIAPATPYPSCDYAVTANETLASASFLALRAFSGVRWAIWRVVRHPFFDTVVFGLIAISAIILALDEPAFAQGTSAPLHARAPPPIR